MIPSSLWEELLLERYSHPDERYYWVQRYLDTLKYRFNAKYLKIGESVEKRPIYALKTGTGEKKVFIVASQHGNETGAFIGLVKMINTINSAEFRSDVTEIRNKLEIWSILLSNPDGSEYLTRENANGVDINRDHEALQEPETKVIHNALSHINPDLVIDLHTYHIVDADRRGILLNMPTHPDIDENLLNLCDKIIKRATLEIDEAGFSVNRFREMNEGNEFLRNSFALKGFPTILLEGRESSDAGQSLVRSSSEMIFHGLSAVLHSACAALIPNDEENGW